MPSDHLIVHRREPLNAEPPLDRLRANPITAQHDFYVRSHGTTPVVDAADYALEVGGLVETPLRLSLSEIEAFPRHTVEAVMQCAGNRRADLGAVHPVLGDPWSAGAIGNARWTGVALADVLRAAGAATAPTLHVAFTSLDEVELGGASFLFGVSIPMAKALSPEVILATTMNDEPLTPDHGYPLRVVTPGFAGIRSPKWLSAIAVRDAPSACPMQAENYKLLPPDMRSAEAIDWQRGTAIDEMPLNAAICEPAVGTTLCAGPCEVRGWAHATGRAVVRVDVSGDGGTSWRQASLEAQPSRWSWTFWSIVLELRPGPCELVVRAWDQAGQTQPARPDDIWNLKGYLSAAWHRVTVAVI